MRERIGIELEEAVELIVGNIRPLGEKEIVPLASALGRVAAESVYSAMENPPFNRSPLDGYAFGSRDTEGASQDLPAELRVVETIYAGEWYKREIQSGEAVRIMTGAPIPPGADCVIRQEDVILPEESGLENIVKIPRAMAAYENYCFAGEDLKRGTELVKQGQSVGWLEQGILASAGVVSLQVYRKPRIALYAVGDELCGPEEELSAGKIYDANCWVLSGRMKELGYPPVITGRMKDDPEEAARELQRIIGQVDLVITTGGVSVGQKDIFHQVLPLLGAERLFWRVCMKPGTPAMFALFRGKPMLHLSGNPFAAMATFELLAVPALERLTGDKRLRHLRVSGILASDFPKTGGRRFLRGRLEDGKVMLPSVEKHSSGILFSMAGCNCLVEIPPSRVPVKAGDKVSVILL